MSRSPHRPPLSADRPIGDPADDRLGHARFAADIARCVAEMTPDDPLVLGLHGSPGSGRTSVLNMVRRQLEAAGVRVHEINPWVHGPALADVLADRVEAAAGDRVVVMMDDVDRLTVGEWAQLTRLVERSLAVPGAAYVLVFDRSESDPVELGRLVQVPFDLPLP
ncbi:MAG TPA: P-loop NTPase fold protein, partial [Gaiellales bacterium]|nr:P-loop NTPase fold protein [Gaiellales bacterium]